MEGAAVRGGNRYDLQRRSLFIAHGEGVDIVLGVGLQGLSSFDLTYGEMRHLAHSGCITVQSGQDILRKKLQLPGVVAFAQACHLVLHPAAELTVCGVLVSDGLHRIRIHQAHICLRGGEVQRHEGSSDHIGITDKLIIRMRPAEVIYRGSRKLNVGLHIRPDTRRSHSAVLTFSRPINRLNGEVVIAAVKHRNRIDKPGKLLPVADSLLQIVNCD